MLKDPLGIVLLVLATIYWAVFFFVPLRTDLSEQHDTQNQDSTKGKQNIPFSIVLALLAGLLTGGILWHVLQDLGAFPVRTIIVAGGLCGLLALLMFRPKKLIVLVLGAVVLYAIFAVSSMHTPRSYDDNPYTRK